jgi:HEAT repeat protein
MGHYAKLEGKLSISPVLKAEHRHELSALLSTQYAPWRLSDDARNLLPPLEEPPQPYERGLQELITTYLEPRGYRVKGKILWEGEEPGDTGTLIVTANQLEVLPDEVEQLSKAGIKQILDLLRSRNPKSIHQATDMMDYFGQSIPGAVEVLIPLLNDPVMEVRWQAAGGLSVLAAEAESAIPALIAALQDPHEWVRSAAATALGAIGPKAAEAIPALEQLRNDPSYGPRGIGQDALERIRVSLAR